MVYIIDHPTAHTWVVHQHAARPKQPVAAATLSAQLNEREFFHEEGWETFAQEQDPLLGLAVLRHFGLGYDGPEPDTTDSQSQCRNRSKVKRWLRNFVQHVSNELAA